MKSKDVLSVSKKIKVDPCLSGPQYMYKHNIFTYIYFLLYLFITIDMFVKYNNSIMRV